MIKQLQVIMTEMNEINQIEINAMLCVVIPTKCFVIKFLVVETYLEKICQTRSFLWPIYGYHHRVVSSKMPVAQTKTLSCCFLVWVALTG